MNLKDYVATTVDVTFRSLSSKTGIAEAQLNRYANGKSLPSLKNAFVIYKKTNKKVKLEDWFKPIKRMEF